MSACVIECVFGNRFLAVYPAVKNYDAYFFTNNPGIKDMIEAAGYKFIFADFPLSDDEIVSSLQSKWVKFLQFLKNEKYSFFLNYDKIIYADHKLELKDSHCEILLEKLNGYEILIRDHHSGYIKNIWEEFGGSMRQPRYFNFMTETVEWIRQKIREGYSEDTTIVWTSLMVYKHLNVRTLKFTNIVYDELINIGTSQCQIIWSILGQKYNDIIKIIKWNEIDMKWEEPKINQKITLFLIIKTVIKIFMPYGLLKLYRLIKNKNESVRAIDILKGGL